MFKSLFASLGGLFFLGVGCLTLVLGSPAPAAAQDALLSQFYGAGVHSFYDRDYNEAMEQLSAAIDGGSKDPRPYYYRGLTQLRQGNHDLAAMDMQVGASLESADVNGAYPVGKSLERIQGADRRVLERYRAVARADNRQRQLRQNAERYEQQHRNETEVLRNAPVGPPPAPLKPVAPPVDAPPVPGPPAPGGAAPAAAGEDSPFGEEPTPPAEPAAEEPAAEEPAMEAEEPAESAADAAPEAGAGEADPFADDAKPE